MIEMIEPGMLLVLGLVALIAGFIDAVAGGGGMLTVPALLSIGLPPHIALGTNKLAATFASSTAAWTYYKKQLFSPSFWKLSFIATLAGAILGTLVVDLISTEWLEKVLPLIILAAAVYTVWHPHPKGNNHELPEKCEKFARKQWLQGTTLGFYDGLAGPGTGAFWTVSNMALYRLDILMASGLAKAMNFTSNLTSLVTFAILGHINFALGLTMGVCLMLGAYIGAHSAIRFGAKFIRPVFVTVVIVLAVKLAWQAWF
ncbi:MULTISPECIES: sulfite exporter TauE/SafE family protein [Photobacterium]|uniref:Probable membrane transporter protein n=1 Tax=Photobacterium ganghwense TaxID=320778 RepID=A0A0J1GY03_9GAMM|nr:MULTISPECIES: TSUP family transporter [Photobacterium]KLV04314.1 membrane protein [Photobacterium ganghwense]MBV1840919.1 TSUP family transporter [Photobacterium ganghwense]QSV14869.1 TSUP family transporter [Photobacterium ganghwense]